jgi:chromosome partitioning protein
MKVTILNQKGGVGKTTISVNLAHGLARAGKRTLLIDLDPQAHSTVIFCPEIPKGATVKELFERRGADIRPLIRQAQLKGEEVENLFIVPSTIHLAVTAEQMISQHYREKRLDQTLSRVESEYDYILLDCPPSLGLITVNALLAANAVLIPVQAEPRSVRATERTMAAVRLVQRKLKRPDLRVLGLLLTMTSSNNIAREATEVLRTNYGDLVLNTTVSRRVRVAEDTLYRAPVLAYAPRSEPANDYRALAAEVMERTLPEEVVSRAG